MSNWEKVGEVSVDAGLVMIGDPCYVAADHEHPVHDWGKFCNLLEEHDDKNGYPTVMQLEHAPGAPGLGVVVSSGYGDGSYPVYIKKNGDGRVVELKVVFD